MAKHLNLNIRAVSDAQGNIDEGPSKVLEQKDLAVFDTEHPRPKNAVLGDEAVLKLL